MRLGRAIVDELASAGVLSREEIRRLIDGQMPLVSDFVNLETQLQPNGFDLTLAAVQRHLGSGTIGIDNADRVLPELEAVSVDDAGFAFLTPGPYHITYAETVSLPADLMALGRPRSSLTRSGVAIHTAVWDAGYSGRSTSLLVVNNPAGFRVQIGARVAQLVFVRLSQATVKGYEGIYQGENTTTRN